LGFGWSGRDDRGCPSGAAAELGQDLPALEEGDGTLADGADPGVLPVDGLVSAGQWRPVTAALEGRADAAASALVRLVGEVVMFTTSSWRDGTNATAGQRLHRVTRHPLRPRARLRIFRYR
jgi:hypothetical protein